MKNVSKFIQKSVEIFSTYERQFQGQIDIEMTRRKCNKSFKTFIYKKNNSKY